MRTIGTIVLAAGLYGMAMAQAPFTIVRPAEGARVREIVNIQIPKNSVPAGGYISFWVNGQFIEATLPEVKGNMYQYPLDTKKRGLKDGPCVIEAVLHGTQGAKTTILDRSKVNVTIANVAQVTVPADGRNLRYRFTQGRLWVYDIHSTTSLLSISEAEEKRGGTAAEQVLIDDEFDLQYAIDNVYPSGNGLIRIQPVIGPSGKVVFQNREGGLDVVDAKQIIPFYVEMTTTGAEEYFASFSWNDPLQGGVSRNNFGIYLPLPQLPFEAHKVGDSWAATAKFLLKYHGYWRADDVLEYNKNPVSGRLVGYEWEQDHPCAHIQYEFKLGKPPKSSHPLDVAGSSFADPSVEYKQDVWLAVDMGTVVRSDAVYTVEGLAASGGADISGGGGAPGGAGLAPGGGGGRGGRGGGGLAPGGGGAGVAPPSGLRGGGGGGQDPSIGGGGFGTGGGLEGKIRIRYRVNMLLKQ